MSAEMIEISEEFFKKYIVECDKFYLAGNSPFLDMYYREADDELVAIKDSAGRYFSFTTYWVDQP